MKVSTAPTAKAVLIGAVGLLVPASQVVALDWPRIWAPFPLVLVLPLFEGIPWPVVIVMPALAFLLAMSFVFARRRRPPLLSFVLATAVALGAWDVARHTDLGDLALRGD